MWKLILAALVTLPQMAGAAGWVHDAGPMGQFGGFVESSDGGSELSYGCALSSGITVWLKGKHARADIMIDGAKVPPPEAFGYQAQQDATSFGYQVAPDAAPKEKAAFNALLARFAGGKVLTVQTDVASVTFPLPAGGTEMLSCEIN